MQIQPIDPTNGYPFLNFFSVLASAVVGFLCAYAFAHPSIATLRRLNRATDDYGIAEALSESITAKGRRF